MSRFHPPAMFTDQIDQPVDCLHLRDVELNGLFPDVEIHLSRGASDVTKIRIGHFAWTIHDASHDRNFDTLQMSRGRFYPRGRRLQIEQRATARRACHVVGLEDPSAGRLQDVVGQPQ